jgi:hypothetical protein
MIDKMAQEQKSILMGLFITGILKMVKKMDLEN